MRTEPRYTPSACTTWRLLTLRCPRPLSRASADEAAARVEQARALNNWAAGRDRPAVAAGTFFFDLPIGDPPGSVEAFAAMTAGDQWRWLTPDTLVPTRCERGERLDDFVFVSAEAGNWATDAEIMFRQSGYCRDSDRTSSKMSTW